MRVPLVINGHEEVHSFLKMDLNVAAPARARLFWPCCWIGAVSLFCLSLCVFFHRLLFVLSVAPSLHVCQSVLSVALADLSPALSVPCVAPLSVVLLFLSVVLAVLSMCLSVFFHLAGSFNKIKGFAFRDYKLVSPAVSLLFCR
ncbi:unnamed protein product [Arctogadus glacialis]